MTQDQIEGMTMDAIPVSTPIWELLKASVATLGVSYGQAERRLVDGQMKLGLGFSIPAKNGIQVFAFRDAENGDGVMTFKICMPHEKTVTRMSLENDLIGFLSDLYK